MRFRSIRIRNLGPHRDLSVDFDSLGDAKLVAVCGPNGSGKTVFLELLSGGALYRECRTRGTLASLATSRDASLEVQLENGKPWTIRHTVDAVSARSESVVIGADGTSATSTGKVKEFDAWAAAHLPSPELLYGSQVIAQGSGGFLDLKPGDRKAVILRLLGVERLEPMAKAARERARLVDTQAASLQALFADSESRANVDEANGHVVAQTGQEAATRNATERAQRALDVARELAGNSALAWERYREQKSAYDALVGRHSTAESMLSSARTWLETIDVEAVAARKEAAKLAVAESTSALESARLTAVDLQRRIDRAKQVEARKTELTAELTKELSNLADLELRIKNNRAVLANAIEIRDAVARRLELTAEVQRLELVCTEQRGLSERYAAEATSQDSARNRHAEAADEADIRIARAQRVLAGKQEAHAAAEMLDSERIAESAARDSVEGARGNLEALRGLKLVDAEGRLRGLRGGLCEITNLEPDLPIDAAQAIALQTLEVDDDLVSEATGLPALIEAAESELTNSLAELRKVEERVQKLTDLAARLPTIRAAEEEFATETTGRDFALQAAAESEGLAQQAHRMATEAAKARRAALEKQDSAKAELTSLERLAAKAAVLDTAEARIAELSPVAEAAGARVGTLRQALALLPQPENEPALPDLKALQVAVDAAQRGLQDATAALARVESDREHVTAEVERLTAEEASLREQLAAAKEPTEPEQAPALGELEAMLAAAKRDHSEAVASLAKAQAALEAAKLAARKALEYRTQLETVRAEQADWNRLAEDLGRDGLQAALVDAACAQITTLTNDLLHSCVGTRWTVSLETQRLSADGKKQLEGFDVNVLDTEAGRDTTVETLSGGERVLVGEAISLALTTLACSRAGIERPTLVRDETGAALDPAKARAHVAMLRRASDMIGADRVLFVSHSREVQELADARIALGGRPDM